MNKDQSKVENGLTLAEAARLVPGQPHPSCLWRWARYGIKARGGERVRLEHSRFGGRVFTSREALETFGRTLAERDAEYFDVREGVLVMDVLRGSLAARANLTPGDVIIRVDRRDVGSMNDLRAALATPARRGETIITVVRNGDRVRLTLPR